MNGKEILFGAEKIGPNMNIRQSLKTFFWIWKSFRAGKIVDHYFYIGNYECQLRCLPKAFKEDERALCKLVDEGKSKDALEALEAAYSKWGCDPDLIRIGSLADYELASDEQEAADNERTKNIQAH